MKKKLDLQNWNRKEHFEFFKDFDEPFYGATVTIDCTHAYKKAKELDCSFFIYSLHKTLLAINAIPEFTYRIENNEVIIHDNIDASATIGRPDGTFGFSLIPFSEELTTFKLQAQKEMTRVASTTGLFTRSFDIDNLIHFSAIPWLNFTSLSHARSYSLPDSCPKISFGKITTENNNKTMPMSVHVHHALIDGLQLSQFIDLFQELMNN